MGYDHTYGVYAPSKGEAAEPYYDDSLYQQEQMPKAVHGRSTSTSDMFALDGFGLGFESGYDSTPVAGNRKMSGTTNADFGVDMSDVPVLRRVRVES